MKHVFLIALAAGALVCSTVYGTKTGGEALKKIWEAKETLRILDKLDKIQQEFSQKFDGILKKINTTSPRKDLEKYLGLDREIEALIEKTKKEVSSAIETSRSVDFQSILTKKRSLLEYLAGRKTLADDVRERSLKALDQHVLLELDEINHQFNRELDDILEKIKSASTQDLDPQSVLAQEADSFISAAQERLHKTADQFLSNKEIQQKSTALLNHMRQRAQDISLARKQRLEELKPKLFKEPEFEEAKKPEPKTELTKEQTKEQKKQEGLKQLDAVKKQFDQDLDAILKQIRETKALEDVEYRSGPLGSALSQLEENAIQKIRKIKNELLFINEVQQSEQQLESSLRESIETANNARAQKATELLEETRIEIEKFQSKPREELKPKPIIEPKEATTHILDYLSRSLKTLSQGA